MIDIHVKFFDITKCGLYARGDNEPTLGEIVGTLSELSTWGSDRELINTKCYEADHNEDLFNTYFCGYAQNQNTNDSVLILWNEIANDNGIVSAIDPNQKPGDLSLVQNDFRGAIPGSPSYFWFIPSHKVFATIKLPNSSHGRNNLEEYLRGFLANKSKYRVIDADENIVGYSEDGSEENISPNLSPRFESSPRKNPRLVDELISNVEKIKKIIKKETIDYSLPDNRPFLERLFSGLLPTTPSFTQSRKITHELEYQPTLEELNTIIAHYYNKPEGSSLRNIGFKYNGKVVMLSGINVSFSSEINISIPNNKIISPEVLLSSLTHKRSTLIACLSSTEHGD